MQDYNPIQPTGLISADRAKINSNIESVMSHFSGNMFPTTNLFEGMYCWRSDLKRMYQLGADLVNWTLVNDMSQGYNSVAHASRADYATKDEDGNPIKETYYKQASLDDLKKALFPIGSVYITMTNTNPGTFLGGTWQQIAGGRTLIGASASYVAGTMGGTETQDITLTSANIPSHTHTVTVTQDSAGAHSHTRGTMNITGSLLVRNNRNSGYAAGPGPTGAFTEGSTKYRSEGNADDNMNDKVYNFDASRSWSGSTSSVAAHSHNVKVSVANTGSGNSFSISHVQPYLVCYFWQKVAD